MGIKLIRLSPYYAQANGQAEASNKSLIKLIKRKIDEHPKRWHEVLSEALWAYRMSCHGAIKTTPYQLVYGQEAVLPWEVKDQGGSRQNDLTAEDYAALISDSIEDATELRLWSLEKIKENKAKVARAYNKKVKPKEFQVGDLVWEAHPLGTRDKEYGKWSPNWHGPYKVVQVLKGNAYMLEMLDGVKFRVNGQHLKKYFPRKSRLLKKGRTKEEPIALFTNPTELIAAGSSLAAEPPSRLLPEAFRLPLPVSSLKLSSSSSFSLSAQSRKRFVGGYPAKRRNHLLLSLLLRSSPSPLSAHMRERFVGGCPGGEGASLPSSLVLPSCWRRSPRRMRSPMLSWAEARTERSEEVEEDEDIVAMEEGFLVLVGRIEQGDEVANRLAQINKGDAVKI
ncbi:hypothetical protein QYE76_044183 [Lolium multiflorum]|uniref:Integrase catalytic domain-containing protein n=1 Tax=Lolium multiflorum TaxID=4521 RepID=A0AAD8TIN1_LOLMU|nr:hypothetical protein QYE76_044183 [Lolium multiflorum]